MERIALVTGGNRGIGLAISKLLSERSCYVYIGSRNIKEGMQAANKAGIAAERHGVLQLDITQEMSINAALQQIMKDAGRLDILINNAGVLPDDGQAGLKVSIEQVKQAMTTNAYGPLLLMQNAIPLMQEKRYGRIVNISTDMSLMRSMYAGSLAYRMSKAALNAMTKVIATEVSGENILINAMSPGWVRTAMGGPGAPRTPEEAADTALYLATLPDNGPNGCFFKDRKLIPW